MFDLDALKQRYEITDNSKDAELTRILNTSIKRAENYCNRLFEYKESMLYFFQIVHRKQIAQLTRLPYDDSIPIQFFNLLNIEVHPSFKVNPDTGIVTIHQVNIHSLKYWGGFVVYPSDLETAFFLIADYYYKQEQPEDNISRITIPDVGSMTYDLNYNSLDAAYTLLKPYRIYHC